MSWADVYKNLDYLCEHNAIDGVAAIIAERREQIEHHGYDAAHDRAMHQPGDLSGQGALRAAGSAQSLLHSRNEPLDPRTELPAAGALIAAEIDRELG